MSNYFFIEDSFGICEDDVVGGDGAGTSFSRRFIKQSGPDVTVLTFYAYPVDVRIRDGIGGTDEDYDGYPFYMEVMTATDTFFEIDVVDVDLYCDEPDDSDYEYEVPYPVNVKTEEEAVEQAKVYLKSIVFPVSDSETRVGTVRAWL